MTRRVQLPHMVRRGRIWQAVVRVPSDIHAALGRSVLKDSTEEEDPAKARVRAGILDDEPLFCGSDVASTLGYLNPARAVNDHCKALKILKRTELVCLNITDAPARGMIMIPEREVYRLIMRSNLSAAQQFEEWIVDTDLKHPLISYVA